MLRLTASRMHATPSAHSHDRRQDADITGRWIVS